jgi:hypothetical protein
VAPVVPAASATRTLRARIRAALDPGEGMAMGARWERGMDPE